jgi:hypothetical protein
MVEPNPQRLGTSHGQTSQRPVITIRNGSKMRVDIWN